MAQEDDGEAKSHRGGSALNPDKVPLPQSIPSVIRFQTLIKEKTVINNSLRKLESLTPPISLMKLQLLNQHCNDTFIAFLESSPKESAPYWVKNVFCVGNILSPELTQQWWNDCVKFHDKNSCKVTKKKFQQSLSNSIACIVRDIQHDQFKK